MKKRAEKRFVICVKNTDCEDLSDAKVYEVLPDPKAEAVGLVRVVDESGEDYLYQSNYFLPIELPHSIERALAAA